ERLACLARLQSSGADRVNARGAAYPDIRTAAGRWHPDTVAAGAVPHPFPHRLPHLVLGSAVGDTSLHTAHRLAPRPSVARAAYIRLCVPVHRPAVHQLLPVLAEGRGRLDAVLSAHRLPDGVRHRAR